jgi:hypothetical protein
LPDVTAFLLRPVLPSSVVPMDPFFIFFIVKAMNCYTTIQVFCLRATPLLKAMKTGIAAIFLPIVSPVEFLPVYSHR